MVVVILVVVLIVIGIAMLIGRAVGVRPNMGFPLGLVALYVLAAWWPIGWIDVQIACRRDGGVRGTPPKIEGFLFGNDPIGIECDDCRRLVVDGLFQYVDFRADRTWAPIGITEGQYYRVSRGRTDQAECTPPDRYVDVRSMPNGCFTITLLPGAPSEGYRFVSGPGKLVGLLGSQLRTSNMELRSLETGKAIVTVRRYHYGSPLNEWLAGGGDILYRCPRKAVDFNDFMRLISLAHRRE
jgi:hypothetical protein